MRLFAVGIVGNEADIIGYTILHLIHQGVSQIIVGAHNSTDGTIEILESYAPAVRVHRINDPAYRQSSYITSLSDRAFDLGADWVIPFDADECWVAPQRQGLDEYLSKLPPAHYHATRWDYWPARVSVIEENPYLRVSRRNVNPTLPPKGILCGKAIIGPGNHFLFDDMGRPLAISPSDIAIHHVPFRSRSQFRKKVLTLGASFDLMFPDDPNWNNWASHYPVHSTYRDWQENGERAIASGWAKVLMMESENATCESRIPWSSMERGGLGG